MHNSKYTPPKPTMFGLHDAVDFLEGLDYDVSALDNQGIMSLLSEVMEGLKENEDDII
jgi:hypothetical protein